MAFEAMASEGTSSIDAAKEEQREAQKEESFQVQIQGKIYKITLGRAAGKEVAFLVTENGKQVQKVSDLGSQFAFFEVNGQKVRQVVHDFTGDGIPEFALRTTQPPLIGSLWVFRWNGRKFEAIRGPRGDGYYAIPLESPVKFTENKNLSFRLGKSENSLIWEKQKFTLKKSNSP